MGDIRSQLTDNDGKLIVGRAQRVRQNGIAWGVGRIRDRIVTSDVADTARGFWRGIQIDVEHRDGYYLHRDSDLEWWLPDYEPNGFYSVKNWDEIYARHQDHLPRGGTLFKIGAATGEDLPRAIDNIGPDGRIVAVEADPANYDCLTRNIELHQMGIVESLQHAVSHSADETTEFKRNLRGHTSHRLDESHFGNHPDRSEYETITMQTTTADDIAAERNLGEIDMLSVTVNRFEAAVLEGAERTLERTKYVVIPGNRDRQYGDAHAVLTDAGFERIEIGNRGNLYERTSG